MFPVRPKLSSTHDAIAQEAFVALHFHFLELGPGAAGEEGVGGAGEGGGFGTAEDSRAGGEVDFVDEVFGEERAEEAAATFAVEAADLVVVVEGAQEIREVYAFGIGEVEISDFG